MAIEFEHCSLGVVLNTMKMIHELISHCNLQDMQPKQTTTPMNTAKWKTFLQFRSNLSPLPVICHAMPWLKYLQKSFNIFHFLIAFEMWWSKAQNDTDHIHARTNARNSLCTKHFYIDIFRVNGTQMCSTAWYTQYSDGYCMKSRYRVQRPTIFIITTTKKNNIHSCIFCVCSIFLSLTLHRFALTQKSIHIYVIYTSIFFLLWWHV